jgi:hypothetical protein
MILLFRGDEASADCAAGSLLETVPNEGEQLRVQGSNIIALASSR